MRAACYIVALCCLAGFGYLSWTFHKFAREHHAKADIVAQGIPFSENQAFVTPARMESATAKQLRSPHAEKLCLAYSNRVSLRYPDYDSDTNDYRSETIHNDVSQVPDLALVFPEKSLALDLEQVGKFSQAEYWKLEELPEYVEPDRIPDGTPRRRWFVVFESVYQRGQTVLVGAQLDQEGQLAPHPELGELLLFSGTKADCVEFYRDKATRPRIWSILNAILAPLVALTWFSIGNKVA